jgi:acyl phosphate:glycerol-3-phosphate acyltransferase
VIIALVLGGYLLGSIPAAWLVARAVTGHDLRQMGSGNVGVMNTALSLHRWAGLLVFLAEIAKGALAVIVSRAWEGSEVAVGLTVLATIVGTRWPIWLRGTGGRGNTAAMAALFVLNWVGLAVMLALWFVARLLTRSNFTATRISLLLLPAVFGFISQSWWAVLFGAAFALIFVSTHKRETDDHLLIKKHWPTFWDFLTSPPRS